MVLLFLFIIFLFPVAIYCSILAGINRRTSPLMVSGTWDGVGLLFASSGFLLVAGPAILSALFDNEIKPLLLRGGRAVLPLWINNVFGNWGFYWFFYYGLVIVGSILLLRCRTRSTIIYNIEPGVFDNIMNQSLQGNHYLWQRQGKKVIIWPQKTLMEKLPGEETAIATEDLVIAPSRSSVLESMKDTSYVEVEEFPSGCNVALTWHGQALNYRFDIERELQKKLAAVYTEENPAGAWLLGISGAMFLMMIFGMLMVIVSFLFGFSR